MHTEDDARARLIVALDVPTVADARALIGRLGDEVSFYKIGLELVMAGGLDLARELAAAGRSVFLDMKFLDIGNTVERAVASAAELGSPASPSMAMTPRRSQRRSLVGAIPP